MFGYVMLVGLEGLGGLERSVCSVMQTRGLYFPPHACLSLLSLFSGKVILLFCQFSNLALNQ